MALFSSQLLTAASGSIGGLTLLNSRGGMTLRAKAYPVDPSTPLQNTFRAHTARLVAEWTHLLTAQQRNGWKHYATNNLRPNALGRLINIGPLPMWIRCQLPRRNANLPIIRDPPTIFTDATFTPIVGLTIKAALQRLVLPFDRDDRWARENGSAMLVFIAPPVNPTVNRYRGSYRYHTRILGHPLFTPLSPRQIQLHFHVVVGQRVFVRVTVTREDGRYSTGQVAFATVT